MEGEGSADLQEMYKVREGIGHGSWWAPSKYSEVLTRERCDQLWATV